KAKSILEEANLMQLLVGPGQLPDPLNLDVSHRDWRNAVIVVAQRQSLAFTHGVAAKLVNIYLKAGFVCAGYHADPRVQALHPPIDGLPRPVHRTSVSGGTGPGSTPTLPRFMRSTAASACALPVSACGAEDDGLFTRIIPLERTYRSLGGRRI